MKDLHERVLELAEERGVGKKDAIVLYYQGWKKLGEKYGGSLDTVKLAYDGHITSQDLLNDMNRKDEILFRYVRRYMKNGN